MVVFKKNINNLEEKEVKLLQNYQELIDRFLVVQRTERGLAKNSILSYSKDLINFFLYAQKEGVESIVNIDKIFLRLYMKQMRERGMKRSSFLRSLSTLNGFFKFLMSESIVVENPIVQVKRPKTEVKIPKYFNKEEIEKILTFAEKTSKNTLLSSRNALLIEMLCTTGMRISELCAMKMSSVRPLIDGSEKDIIVIEGKGKKERMVPVRDITIQKLNTYLLHRKNSLNNTKHLFLFPSNSAMGHITRENVALLLKKVAQLANIDHKQISPHKLRHSFATNLCNSNVNLRVVQELLGHSDISSTEIYLHATNVEVIDFVNNLHPLARFSKDGKV